MRRGSTITSTDSCERATNNGPSVCRLTLTHTRRTFEYAPFWFVGGIFYEYVVLATVMKLRLADVSVLDGLHMIVDAPFNRDADGRLAASEAAATTPATAVTRRVGRSPARTRR